jgi:phosphomannomutase
MPAALSVSHIAGLHVEYRDWCCNLRTSNTEPLVRFNVASKGDQALMAAKIQELLQKIYALSAI